MKSEIVKILQEQGVKEAKSKNLLSAMNTLIEKNKVWEDLSKVTVSGEDDTQGMEIAKTNRLSIKKDRVELEKFVKANRATIQERMSDDVAEDKAWLKVFQAVEAKAKSIEKDLEEKEKLAERLQEERNEKMRQARFEQLSTVCDNPEDYDLVSMPEKAFIAIYEGFVAAKEKAEREAAENERLRQEAEALEQKRLEEEAEALAKRNSLQKERYALMENYAQHGPTVDMTELAELEEDYFNQVLEKKKDSYAVWKQEQENKEQERLAQVRALAEAAEKTRKAQEELEALKKKEAEEKAARDAEELRIRVEAEREAKALAEATDKEKLKVFMASFVFVPQEMNTKEGREVEANILSKFGGFISWAAKEINKL